jgi:c(7)-type cytochrome triheme protein
LHHLLRARLFRAVLSPQAARETPMRSWFPCLLAFFLATAALAQGSAKKRRPLPDEFGRAVINNHSEKAGFAPVVFDHWLHRAKYTCRLCHVDLGFAMKAGGSDIKAADNIKGFFCGACHNGRTVSGERKIFASCDKPQPHESRPACSRCHSQGREVKEQIDFGAFTRGLPRGRFGNGIDWEKAEEQGLIHPSDFLEGVSIARKPLTAQKDFALSPRLVGMPGILFSHKKHTVWNGCELCHPEIFVGVKRGVTRYTMVENFEGKYCGACHLSVAFPLTDCQRCHTEPVQ